MASSNSSVKVNPYSLASSDALPQIDEPLKRKAKQAATKLAAGGSVVGSISKKLQTMGIDASNAEAIALDAVMTRSRFERLQGVGIVGFGMCVVFAGYLLSFVFIRRIPLAIAITGLFFVMLGFSRIFHRSKIHRPGPRPRKMQ
ncbi:hypothetical protein [Novipirellula sp.]|uniref:hypothetical protein n=1 Tax=Novipirellula sp. TaxID=2795430 RepID=UPI00356AA31B